MKRLPTPDELGEMLQRGEIAREEAIEIMDQRARDEAMRSLFNPLKTLEPESPDTSRNSTNATGKTER